MEAHFLSRNRANMQTIIDVWNGKLSMTILGETIEFQRTIEEEQRLSSPGATDPKTGLGVKKKAKLKKKPKLCPNKPPNPKLEFDDIGGCDELQMQLLDYLNPKRGALSRHERIAGYSANGVLDVH
ncbi:hypothetical protein ACOSQ3_016967 [Xanthoceras sorbifolium]